MTREESFMQIAQYWDQAMPFNKLQGLEITQFNSQKSAVSRTWHDKLIGNPEQKTLHGGITAPALDLAGGALTAVNILTQLPELSPKIIAQSSARLSIIDLRSDLRSDFLRPGRAKNSSQPLKLFAAVTKQQSLGWKCITKKVTLLLLAPAPIWLDKIITIILNISMGCCND